MDYLQPALEKIIQKNPKRILLQVPEGLKTKFGALARELGEKTGAEVVLSGEPCYGACDLPLDAAKILNCDLIVHLGHSDFGVNSKIPVIYIPIQYDIKIPENLKEELKGLRETKIAIFASVQFKGALDSLEETLVAQNKEIVAKETILGCSKIDPNSELNLFIGSGKFHPLALKGKVLQIDLEQGKLIDLTDKIRREELKRMARLEKLKDAKKVGILVSTKPGQFYSKSSELKARFEREGKEAQILVFNEIVDEKLLGLDFDAYVNTACPRILDMPFSKPVINLKDF